jgi:hypothetical protein
MLDGAPRRSRRRGCPTPLESIAVARDFRILDQGRSVMEGPIEMLTDGVVQKHLSV